MPGPGAGDPLHKDAHLLVHLLQPALAAVFKGGGVHRAGIDAAHGVFELLQPLLERAGVDTEHGFILSGKCISEPVFQKTGRTDNDRALAEIFQQGPELLPDIRRESAGQQCIFQCLRLRKISFLRALLDPGLPAVVGYDIRIKDI